MSYVQDNVIPAPWFGRMPVDVYDFLSAPVNRIRNRIVVRSGHRHPPLGHKVTDGLSGRGTCDSDNDMQLENVNEGFAESSMAGTRRGLKRSTPLPTVTESDCESCDDDIWDDKEVKEEELGSAGRVLVWRRPVRSSRVAARNVLQIPQKVVKGHLTDGHETIVLYDSDRGREYNCVLHRNIRKTCTERFISKEWYTFVRDRKIKSGDKIGFSLRIPDADTLMVTVKRKKPSK